MCLICALVKKASKMTDENNLVYLANRLKSRKEENHERKDGYNKESSMFAVSVRPLRHRR